MELGEKRAAKVAPCAAHSLESDELEYMVEEFNAFLLGLEPEGQDFVDEESNNEAYPHIVG